MKYDNEWNMITFYNNKNNPNNLNKNKFYQQQTKNYIWDQIVIVTIFRNISSYLCWSLQPK